MESASAGAWQWSNRIARTLFLLFAIPVAWLSSWLGMLHSVLFHFLLFIARLESYFAWDRDILAPVDGAVVKASSRLPDQEIGESDGSIPEGNCMSSNGKAVMSFSLTWGTAASAWRRGIRSRPAR